jgi:hypothetical protein
LFQMRARYLSCPNELSPNFVGGGPLILPVI